MATSETGPGELYRNVSQEVPQQTGTTIAAACGESFRKHAPQAPRVGATM